MSLENQRLRLQIKHRGCRVVRFIGAARGHAVLSNLSECCCEKRIHRLMNSSGLRLQPGYRRSPNLNDVPAAVASFGSST
jgi:hypothetical protein